MDKDFVESEDTKWYRENDRRKVRLKKERNRDKVDVKKELSKEESYPDRDRERKMHKKGMFCKRKR